MHGGGRIAFATLTNVRVESVVLTMLGVLLTVKILKFTHLCCKRKTRKYRQKQKGYYVSKDVIMNRVKSNATKFR